MENKGFSDNKTDQSNSQSATKGPKGVNQNIHDQNGDVPKSKEAHKGSPSSCLQRISSLITGNLEKYFQRLGESIGRRPWRYIAGSVFVCLFCSIGFIFFSEVTDPVKLWVPTGSRVLEDKAWVEANYPSTVAYEQIIAVSANMLTPTGLAAMLDLYQESLTIASSSGVTLDGVCIKSGTNCMVRSILELWSYDNATIRGLSQATILATVNSATTSPMFGDNITLSDYLGSTTTDNNGDIATAEAATITWLNELNSTALDWEVAYIAMGQAGHNDLTQTFVLASRSWKDENGDAVQNDTFLLTIGYVLVIFVVVMVLGKFNFMEQKAWLTLCGFLCIGLAMLVSIGFSSAIGQEYGPIHSILPFLLLGIGVDDMFVIMGSLNGLDSSQRQMDIPSQMGLVLKRAGISITVTSVTDFIAFFIGATTVIPALRSFCVYAGVGIIALYLLQAIFFTSCLTLDLRRQAESRDACCCCVRHGPQYTPSTCSQTLLVQTVFQGGLAKLIVLLPFKIVVVMVALSLFGANLYGLIHLRQYYDPNKYLPSDSYAYAYSQARNQYFQQNGATGYVYCGSLGYWDDQTALESLEAGLQSSQFIYYTSTDSWFTALVAWLGATIDPLVTAMLDTNNYPTSLSNFLSLTYDLTTVEATRTASYIKFSGGSGSSVYASRFPFKHISMDDAATQIAAMETTRDMVGGLFSSSECFPYSAAYGTWEINKVIREELYRNLGIAVACVFVVTLILIANFRTSVIVFIGVGFTLVDVAGTMHFWGLTIETMTVINLILSIGLAVDYNAHIGHTFMTVKGERNQRAQKTVREMGPPVFYGGFSTFLAFVLLSSSSSYVAQTFFKVNFLVVLYGLFHGLVFLPIMLSWLGPPPYETADRECKKPAQTDIGKDGLEKKHVTNNTDNGLPPLRNTPSKQHVPNGDDLLNRESLKCSSKQQTKSEEVTTTGEAAPPPSYNQEHSSIVHVES